MEKLRTLICGLLLAISPCWAGQKDQPENLHDVFQRLFSPTPIAPNPRLACARSLAILADDLMPYAPEGYRVVDIRSVKASQLAAVLHSLGANNVIADSAYLGKVDAATADWLPQLGNIPVSDSTPLGHTLFGHGADRHLRIALALPYELGGNSPQFSRMFAAYVAGQAQLKQAIPLIEAKLVAERSEEAKLMYQIALAQLKGESQTDTLLQMFLSPGGQARFSTNNLVYYHYPAVPGRTPVLHPFVLSTQGAGALGLAFVGSTDAAKAALVNENLLAYLQLLYVPVRANSPDGTNYQVRLLNDPPEEGGHGGRQYHSSAGYLANAVIFSLGMRNVEAAYPFLEEIFMGLGHASPTPQTVDFPIGGGATIPMFRQLNADRIPMPSLLEAMYRINPEATKKAVAKKLGEFRLVTIAANENRLMASVGLPEDTEGTVQMNALYLDGKLYMAIKELLSAKDSAELLAAYPPIPRKTHGDGPPSLPIAPEE
ncbi:hypothetical protein K2X33_05840 [bacterium]|nr:hypothetical protein [bacterium]